VQQTTQTPVQQTTQTPVQQTTQTPVQQTTQTPVQTTQTTSSTQTQQSPSDRAFGDLGQALAAQAERVHRGVRVVAPAGTHQGAIDRMCSIIDREIGKNEYAQQHMLTERVTVVLIPTNTPMTDLPQFASLRGRQTFDGRDWSRVRGSGGVRASDGSYAIGIAEESLVQTSGRRTGYNATQVAMHELAHAVHSKGMTRQQQERVRRLFEQQRSLDTNRDTQEFSDHYASSNVMEYFAQATNVFFGTNAGRDGTGRVSANGRDWLRTHDPDMYAFLVEFYEGRHDRDGDLVS